MREKYFVFHGKVNCDSKLHERIYRITEFVTAEEVTIFRLEFEKNLREDDSQVFFRVFKGRELKIEPKQTVVEYELKE